MLILSMSKTLLPSLSLSPPSPLSLSLLSLSLPFSLFLEALHLSSRFSAPRLRSNTQFPFAELSSPSERPVLPIPHHLLSWRKTRFPVIVAHPSSPSCSRLYPTALHESSEIAFECATISGTKRVDLHRPGSRSRCRCS